MKSSYKLYGTFWDKKAVSNKRPEIQCINNIIPSETIVLSEVLNNEQPLEINNADGHIHKLYVDFVPANDATIVWNFYLKRLLQIMNYYNVNILNCSEPQQTTRLENAIKNYQKENTE